MLKTYKQLFCFVHRLPKQCSGYYAVFFDNPLRQTPFNALYFVNVLSKYVGKNTPNMKMMFCNRQ